MSLFAENEINTERQFEFDFAKAVCIFGMVFVHCFQMLPLTSSAYEGSLYYTLITVLNSLFGAGTFMVCLGIGLTYTKNNEPNNFIKRGLYIFILGYILNVFRYSLPCCLYFFTWDAVQTVNYILFCFLNTDILQFAGLAFILFGLLEKFKLSDGGIAAVAFVMSVAGSFVRFVDVGAPWANSLLGLFIGTMDDNVIYPYHAPFALLNWFIIVVFGYFFGKTVRRCENRDKFYAVTTPVSAAIVFTYMAIAIPNKYGMMSGENIDYFQMTTLGALIIMMGSVFVFGLYHYISKLFNAKAEKFITSLAVNINKTYCIHWIFIGWLSMLLLDYYENGMPTYVIALIALVIYIISSVIAELVKRRNDKKKVIKNV